MKKVLFCVNIMNNPRFCFQQAKKSRLKQPARNNFDLLSKRLNFFHYPFKIFNIFY